MNWGVRGKGRARPADRVCSAPPGVAGQLGRGSRTHTAASTGGLLHTQCTSGNASCAVGSPTLGLRRLNHPEPCPHRTPACPHVRYGVRCTLTRPWVALRFRGPTDLPRGSLTLDRTASRRSAPSPLPQVLLYSPYSVVMPRNNHGPSRLAALVTPRYPSGAARGEPAPGDLAQIRCPRPQQGVC